MIHTTTNGRLTAPPELKTLESGSTVCELRIATDGRNTDDTEYLAVSVWGRTGEACAEHLAKGQAVTVSGPLTGSAWITTDGNPRYQLQINADRVEFGPKARPKANEPHSGQDEPF